MKNADKDKAHHNSKQKNVQPPNLGGSAISALGQIIPLMARISLHSTINGERFPYSSGWIVIL